MKHFSLLTASLLLAVALVTPSLAQNGRSVRAQVAKQNAQERVEAIKEKIAERKATVRADVCARRQTRINSAIERLHSRSSRLKTVIDTMYARVQGFYESGQLTVESYEELKTAVDDARADADAAVSAVESFTVTIDCEDPKAGEQLEAFRTAIDETKTALKDYRKALVELISSLRSAAAEDKEESSEIEAEQEDENEQDNSGDEQ